MQLVFLSVSLRPTVRLHGLIVSMIIRIVVVVVVVVRRDLLHRDIGPVGILFHWSQRTAPISPDAVICGPLIPLLPPIIESHFV